MTETIGERLELLRKELGISMVEMGRRTGVGRDVIANIVYGRTEPKETYVRHVALVFGLSAEYLLTGEGALTFEGLSLEQTEKFFLEYRTLPAPLRGLADDYLQSLSRVFQRIKDTEAAVEKNVEKYRKTHDTEEQMFVSYLKSLMEKQSLSLDRLTRVSSLQKQEVYDVLGGNSPKRSFIIKLGLALHFSFEETQMLLALSENKILSIDTHWDANVIITMLEEAEKLAGEKLGRGVIVFD